MTAQIYPFPVGRCIRNCVACGGHFRQRAAYHRFCHFCYWWDAGLTHQVLAAQAFRRLRAGGSTSEQSAQTN
jgi:hypothetical protein